MNLVLLKFIEKQLGRAKYEYDESVHQWAAWVEGFPGVYAQAPSVEQAREDLASGIEEYVLISIRRGERIRGVALPELPRHAHAKTR